MSKTTPIISIKLLYQGDKIHGHPTPESIATMDKIAGGKEKLTHWQKISDKKHRSLKQLGYWFGHILPTIADMLESYSGFVQMDASGKMNYETLHRALMIEYCVENNRSDMCEMYRTYRNGKYHDVLIASFSFEKLKTEDANHIVSWAKLKVEVNTGVKFETIERKQKENA